MAAGGADSPNNLESIPGRVSLRGLPRLIHPLDGCGFRQYWRHYIDNWPYDLRSLHTRLFATAVVTLRLAPVFLEHRAHRAAIEAQALEHGPVFVVGHWRSGTTHLHNILSRDPQFAWMSFDEAVLPLDCLSRMRVAYTVMNWFLPKNRGMDNVAIDAESPQEEEFALGALGDRCFLKCFYFPRELDRHFRQSVLLEGLDPPGRERLANAYRFIARKMAYAHGGKTVLFKNPANTARMSFLKEAFPHAKFVHIVRDPYSVHPSMMRLWSNLLNEFSWQRVRGIDFSEATFSIYERTMRAHLEDRRNIPESDLHEVRFEQLETDPKGAVRGIYEALGIPSTPEAMRRIDAYIDEQASYQRSEHAQNSAMRSLIAERWRFAFEHWGYPI